jgi:YebC/PmpR family DNA-binding regulatory protein
MEIMMAGHSQFSNIVHRKTAQDKKRAKIFTKIIRDLTVAAKSGGDDPDANPALRLAIGVARAANMTKDTMERAIKRGASGADDSDNYDEIRYEGYGPGGVALVVEALTDNRNRTASDVRSAFNKYGGNLGETNSVTFMFDRAGILQYPLTTASSEDMFEAALEVGAENVETDDHLHTITCDPGDFAEVRNGLNEKFGVPEDARLGWIPKNYIMVSKDQAETLLKLLHALEDSDDVQSVDSNYEVDDATLQSMNDEA